MEAGQFGLQFIHLQVPACTVHTSAAAWLTCCCIQRSLCAYRVLYLLPHDVEGVLL
jgi:hypothetical protein